MVIRGGAPIQFVHGAGPETRDPSTTMDYVRECRVAGAPPRRRFPALARVAAAHRTVRYLAVNLLKLFSKSVPSGIRTRVTALKGLGPGPD
jgi:hypothetical protein